MTQQAKKRSKQSCSELISNVLFKRMGWGGVLLGTENPLSLYLLHYVVLTCLCCCLTCTPAIGSCRE